MSVMGVMGADRNFSRMQVFHGLESLSVPFAASTVAIGTFDGVHMGHKAIIRSAVEDARSHRRPAIVFTFDRHPIAFFAPERAPKLITTPEQRIALIAELGVDALVVARFDETLSELSPNLFIETILKERLGAKAIVEGTNFAFGKDRAGDVAFLETVQNRYDFVLHAIEPVLVLGQPASSTRVRECLRTGEVAEAEAVLGHPFRLEGRVIGGQRLGRTLGYPTANLDLTWEQIVPADGVYAVLATLDDGRTFGGACSIGNRPTIEGAGRSIETYLLDFDEDIYGHGMDLRFVRRLRPEEKFNSLSDLTAQIANDVALARDVLADRWTL